MTYSGSPDPDPGDIKKNQEMLNRERAEAAEQERLAEERRILEEEVPFWRRQKQIEGGEFTQDPEGPHYQSIAAETGIGFVADFLLPSPDPLSRAASFGVGYGANALAQWMRGDWDEFSHGEAVAAGGFQAIPFGTAAKGLKGLRRATAKGALGGATMAQLEVGIDERRRLTGQELFLSSILGGTLAGGFKSAELGGDFVGDVIRNPYQLAPEGSLARMLGDTGGGVVPPPKQLTSHMQSKVKLHQRALNDEMLQWDGPAVARRSKIDEQFQLNKSGKPEGPHIVRTTNTEASRRAKAAWSLGEEVTPADIKIFEESNQSILDGYNWHLHGAKIKVGKTEGHHKGVVRQIFDASNGLNRKYRLKSAKYMQDRIGFELGYHGRNVEPVPIRFHPRVHGIINSRISSSPDRFNVEGVARRLGFPENWQSILTYEERLPLYNEVADAIRESVDAINTSWKVLLSRSDDLTTWSKEDYLELMLDHRRLDNKLKKVASPSFMAQTSKTGWDLKETSTTVLNDILARSGRQDLTLPTFIKQVEADMPSGLKKVIIEQNAWELLKEMVISGKSSAVVMKAHPAIKMTVKQRNSLESYARKIRNRNKSITLTDTRGTQGMNPDD